MKVAVLTDSTCDLATNQAELMGIHIVPLNVHFDGHDWLDHQELRTAELFKRIQAGAEMPATSPPTPERYQNKLEELLQHHDHVLAVHLSSRLSETYQQATELARAFPKRVTVVDTWNSAGALAMQAERAVRLLKEEVPVERVKDALLAVRVSARTNMCIDTLAYLRKNGRIGGAATLVGGLLNLKPIIGLKEGRVEAFGRALGGKRAMQHMTRLLETYTENCPNGRVSFFHNGQEEAVEEMQFVARRLLLHNPFNLELGTVLSAHGGPGVYGFSFEPVNIWHNFKAY